MKYIITNVQYNAGVNKNLLQNILLFAKEHEVDNLLTFVQNGSYKNEEIVDERVFKSGFAIIESLRLNSNLKCKDMKILAQQIKPLTGLNKKLSRDYSYILPSAKIRYLSVANTSKYPRVFMTTGNLTKPNYKLHTAQGRKAQEMHQYGFVYVVIDDNKKFRAQQIEATKRGDFHYYTEKYHSGKVYKDKPEALILGDWHTGDTDPKIRKRTIAMIQRMMPKRVVFHDLFNGHSVNPHEQGDLIQELRNEKRKRLSLSKELKLVLKEIKFFANMFPEINFFVAESNHDIFLERYIRDKKFINDPSNFMFICSLIPEILKDKQPTLEIALQAVGDLPTNFTFLKEDKEFRVRGIELAYHGHRGINGSRGSSSSFDRYNLKMITGHTHTPALYENGMCVGTSTKLKLYYTKGASSWMHAHGILYTSGKYALVTLI